MNAIITKSFFFVALMMSVQSYGQMVTPTEWNDFISNRYKNVDATALGRFQQLYSTLTPEQQANIEKAMENFKIQNTSDRLQHQVYLTVNEALKNAGAIGSHRANMATQILSDDGAKYGDKTAGLLQMSQLFFAKSALDNYSETRVGRFKVVAGRAADLGSGAFSDPKEFDVAEYDGKHITLVEGRSGMYSSSNPDKVTFDISDASQVKVTMNTSGVSPEGYGIYIEHRFILRAQSSEGTSGRIERAVRATKASAERPADIDVKDVVERAARK